MRSSKHEVWRLKVAALVLQIVVPASAWAQSWLPTKGEGSVSIGVQSFYVPYHLRFDGSEGPPENANIRIFNIVMGATYGVSDKIAIDFGVPYVASRYGGAVPEGPDDTGGYHGTFQDVRVNVRYAAWERGLVVMPSLAVVVPTHSYETFGHTAPGRDLRELQLGLGIARSLGPVLPHTYLDVRYSYAIVQGFTHEDHTLNLNRSNADLEVAQLLRSRLTVQAFGSYQFTYGGLDLTPDVFAANHDIHDVAARASFWRMGGGAAWSVNRSLDLYGSVLTTLVGRNTHKVEGVVVGTTWNFSRGGAVVGVAPTASRRIAPYGVPAS